MWSIVCELGQQFTNSFEKPSNKIVAFKWYLFSSDIQQLLPTILIGTQQPVFIECFGSVSANRDTFKRVCLLRNWI